MKNLLKLVFLTGFTFFTLQACGNPLKDSRDSSNKEQYQIKWEGSAGAKLFGSYVIRDRNNYTTPAKVEKVAAKLPYALSFSAPKNSIIGVSGGTLNREQITIKIYKNGSECGQEALTDSGIMANKVCQ